MQTDFSKVSNLINYHPAYLHTKHLSNQSTWSFVLHGFLEVLTAKVPAKKFHYSVGIFKAEVEVKYNLMLGFGFFFLSLEFCFGREPEGKNSDNVKIFCFDYFRTKCLEFPVRDGFCFGFFGFVIFFIINTLYCIIERKI